MNDRTILRWLIGLVLLLSVSVAFIYADPQDDPESKRSLNLIREAYLAANSNLSSGAGVGKYEEYTQAQGSPKRTLQVSADTEIWFDQGRFHIFLQYKTSRRKIRSSRIIFDGQMIMSTEELLTRDKNNKRRTLTQLHSSDKGLQEIIDQHGFPFNPCKLPYAAFYLAPQLDRIGQLAIAKKTDGGYSAQCPSINNDKNEHMEFDFPQQFGFNVSSSRLYNKTVGPHPVCEVRADWQQAGGVWYVKSISDTLRPASAPAITKVFTYSQFQPNIAVDKGLFRVKALEMAPGSSIIDRSPGAPHRVYRNSPSSDNSAAEIDSMAELLKQLPARDSNPNRSPRVHSLLLLSVGTLLVALGVILVLRRRKRLRRTSM